jgi:hypothetical protein
MTDTLDIDVARGDRVKVRRAYLGESDRYWWGIVIAIKNGSHGTIVDVRTERDHLVWGVSLTSIVEVERPA